MNVTTAPEVGGKDEMSFPEAILGAIIGLISGKCLFIL